MAHRRQQRPQRQFQRSPGSFGPPPKRPRTAGPPIPPVPPMEWEYDQYERAPRARYPVYDEYDRMQDYPPPRAPRRDFQYPADDGFYGDYRAERRDPPRRPQQPQHPKPFRQDRQQYPYRPQQQAQRGSGSRHQQQRGPPPAALDTWMDGNRRRQRNRQNRGGGSSGGGGGGGGGNTRRHSPGRYDDKEGSMDRNGMGLQRNWTKTYWAGKGDSPTKRHLEVKRPDVEIPESVRLYILSGMIKSKFRVTGICETFDYFLKENVAKMTPAFTYKRREGQTHCKFYLNNICIAEGQGLTRSDAKKKACDAAVSVMETETPEDILANHERSEVAKLGDDEVDAVDYSMLSHLERYTGEKPLNNFVILQTEIWSTDESKWNWTSVLVQSAAFSRMELHFQLKGQDHKRVICNIHIDGKFIYSGRGRLVKEAKNFAAKGAVAKLDQTCYTLMIKEGTKNDEKTIEEIRILDTTGTMSGGLSEEEFKENVTAFLKKYVDEEDITKPLVLCTEGMDTKERDIIIDISKSMQLVQRNEKVKREEPKKEEKSKDSSREAKKKDSEESKKAEEKEEVQKESEDKVEVKEEVKEEKAEKKEEEKEEKEEPKEDKEKEDDKKTEGTDEVKEEDVKKDDEEKTKEEEKEEEKAEKEETEEKEEKEEEKKEEEPPKPIVLIRKYSGIDMLDYVLNRDGETWKYKAIAPGTQQRQAAEAEANNETEGAAEGEKAEEDGEGAQEAVEGDENAANENNGEEEAEDEMVDGDDNENNENEEELGEEAAAGEEADPEPAAEKAAE